MNLRSNTERWLNCEAQDLIAYGKTNKNFQLAERTVEAVTPCLEKMTEGWLSEVGDVELCMYMSFDPESKKVLASVVKQNDEEFVPRLTVYDEDAKLLTAAFLCDFADALFSVEGGLPVVMFVEVPVKNMAPGFVAGEKLKRYITLNNMLECVQNGWYKFVVAVPGGKAPKKNKDVTCGASSSSPLIKQ